MLSEKQLDLLKNQIIVVLSTANQENQPRSIFVEVNKVENNRIIITDNHLNNTLENIKRNNKVFLLCYQEDYEYVFYIIGEAKYHDSGELLDYVKNNPDNEGYQPKGAIEIEIKSVEEVSF